MQTSPKRTSAYDLRRLVGSVNQLRFNDGRGEVSFFGQKMIILRRDVFRIMREGLERLVGEQAAPFLSYLASGIGLHEGSIFRESVPPAGEQQAGLENLVHAAFEDTNLGLGKIHVGKLDFDVGTTSVTIANCFEALENGPSDEANCMFTSGFLAGLFAEVFDKTVQADEVRCISKGDQECEFQISPTDKSSMDVPAAQTNLTMPSSDVGIVKTEKSDSGIETEVKAERPTTAMKAGEPGAVSKDAASTGKGSATGQGDFDAGVERASRIAKKKQRFWDRMFKKE